jgi:hypothetical protein
MISAASYNAWVEALVVYQRYHLTMANLGKQTPYSENDSEGSFRIDYSDEGLTLTNTPNG